MNRTKSSDITSDLLYRSAAWVPDMTGVEAAPIPPGGTKPWARWVEAELGFRNHWYPVFPARDLAPGAGKAVVLMGEEILFVRNKAGKLYALEDRCAHRGARLSCRPLLYTDDTITCWHHAFTYNLDDGTIACILNDPTSSMAGQAGIKIYPVEEAKGLVFCFVGDIDPPPLAHDVPPGFLDPDMAVRVAEPYVVHANWRLGCEGGYDPSHHFIHNWSPFNINLQIPAAFGFAPEPAQVVETTTYVADDGGPRGFTRDQQATHPRFRATIPANRNRGPVEVVLPLAYDKDEAEIRAMGEVNYTTKVGLWLPCGLKVDPWPYPGLFHNEYYVPRDATSHYYIQCGWRRVSSEAEREDWETGELGRVRWEVPVVEDFTSADAFAREGTTKFYDEEGGWELERLNQPDIELLMWRIFASDQARGIQKPDHTKGRFKR
ncbi:MAG: Rieske 2Fe-2S domain-containing protein [Alphaproteobacteria bacterium]